MPQVRELAGTLGIAWEIELGQNCRRRGASVGVSVHCCRLARAGDRTSDRRPGRVQPRPFGGLRQVRGEVAQRRRGREAVTEIVMGGSATATARVHLGSAATLSSKWDPLSSEWRRRYRTIIRR